MTPLIVQSAELALDLIEKNDVLLPFCKLTDRSDAPVSISPGGDGPLAYDSVRAELSRRLERKEVKEFAVCADVQTKFAHQPAEQRCLRIEFQDGSDRTGIYYFPLTIEGGRLRSGATWLLMCPSASYERAEPVAAAQSGRSYVLRISIVLRVADLKR